MGTSLVLAVGHMTDRGLFEVAVERAASGGTVHVVVPACRIGGAEAAVLHRERGRWPGEHPDVAWARWRLRKVLDAWHHDGLDATGEVGVADPVRAVVDAAARVGASEVILPSHGRAPGWRGRDLARRLRRSVDVPVLALGRSLVGTTTG